MNPQYWLVGTMFGGAEDQLDTFIRRGYWYCWDPKHNVEIPKAVKTLFPQIKVGDRLAAKKMIGPKDPSQIEIRALGIVTDIDPEEWRIYVEWVAPEMSRLAPIKGCMGSIHGPFEVSDWLSDIFRI